jgi:5-methylcytosine-specific restriction endonuclease McrA
MRWTKEEEKYIANNYTTLLPLDIICEKLGRSYLSVRRKAQKMKLSRPRKPLDLEKKRIRQKEAFSRYYKKHSKKVFESKKRSRIKRKKELIEVMGGKCSRCGYDRCFAALEFHHNLGDKEGNMAHIIKNKSKEKALKEIKRCILLCANCHREEHNKGLSDNVSLLGSSPRSAG